VENGRCNCGRQSRKMCYINCINVGTRDINTVVQNIVSIIKIHRSRPVSKENIVNVGILTIQEESAKL